MQRLFLNKETNIDFFWATEGSIQSNLSALAIINRVKSFMKTSITYNENPEVSEDARSIIGFLKIKKQDTMCAVCCGSSNDVSLLREFHPVMWKDTFLHRNSKRGRNGRNGDSFTKYMHAWPEIYLDGMGWIPW